MDQEQPKMEKEIQKIIEIKEEVEEKDDDYSDIKLKKVDVSDVDDFMEWLTDEKVSKFCSWDPFTSKDEAINYITNKVIPHPWHRSICFKDKPVGSISVSVSPLAGNESCKAELGYVVGSKYWGKGIATKAVKMVTSTIFVEWPHLERLEALVDVDNVGSQRVMEKAGFIKEGVLRKFGLQKGKPKDMVMYSLLPTDPPSQLFHV